MTKKNLASRGTKTNTIANLEENPDPRKATFLAFYIDPKSATFGNVYQSAIHAKYSETYAKNLKNQAPEWLSENLDKFSKVHRASKHLDYVLEMQTKVQAMGAFGPIFEKVETYERKKLKNGKWRIKKVVKRGNPIMVENAGLLKIKSDTTEFVLERLDSKNFAKRPSGNVFAGPVQFNFGSDREQYSE